jgi:hypothetical protein
MKNKSYAFFRNDNKDLQLEVDSAYFCSREIAYEVSAHHKRPFIKIENPQTKKSIIRKVRSKSVSGLDTNSIMLDYLSAKELGVKNGDNLTVKKSTFLNIYFSYYSNHPKEDVRIAYRMFLLGFSVSFLQLIMQLSSYLVK